MADGTRKEDGRDASPDEAALAARLRRLGQQLDTVDGKPNAGRGTPVPSSGDPSALARALRLSAELVGGVIVGAGLGWMVDRLLGTSPWGLIVLLLLGFAGGVLSVMRSAGVMPSHRN